MYTDYPYSEFTNWRSFLMGGNRFLWERPCFAPAYARSMGQVVDIGAFLEAMFSGARRKYRIIDVNLLFTTTHADYPRSQEGAPRATLARSSDSNPTEQVAGETSKSTRSVPRFVVRNGCLDRKVN